MSEERICPELERLTRENKRYKDALDEIAVICNIGDADYSYFPELVKQKIDSLEGK